tara:strand:- start:9066 stop:10661 length:1596 start_codon:yes stop_codon:yes gene_type:complete
MAVDKIGEAEPQQATGGRGPFDPDRVQMIDIDTLVLDPANVRTHPQRNLDAIIGSLQAFGQQKPVVVDVDNVVRAGNGLVRAARLLGWSQVAAYTTGLGGSEAIAYAIADNRTAELSEWDDDGLAAQVEALLADGVQVESWGWTEDELTDLMADDYPTPDAEPVDGERLDTLPDDVPAITKPGEVVTLGRHTLTCGDCLEVLRSLPESSVDAVVTDPPYGIGFMGKDWDCDVPGDAFAVEALRVLKPGGHLIAFAATRTVHRLTVAIEDAGFEIRDQIAWLQWQGFPKSHDVSKAIDQHHGAEREVVGRGKGVVSNGGGRYNWHREGTEGQGGDFDLTAPATPDAEKWNGWGTALKPSYEPAVLARKPLEGTVADNVLAHGTGGINVDGCRIGYGDEAWPGPGGDGTGRANPNGPYGSERTWNTSNTAGRDSTGDPALGLGRWPANIYACPKAGAERGDDNHHPTVKPIKLMRWLVRLVTPPGGTVVEPFCGSGTTLIAAEAEGLTCVAVEREPSYCDITRARYQGVIRDD